MHNNDDELLHYGVKGMKWGVRRKSGSTGFVAAGKARDARTRERAEQKRLDGKATRSGLVDVAKGKKSYLTAAKEHDQRTADRAAQKKAHAQLNRKANVAAAKNAGKAYMEKVNAHEAKTAARRERSKKRLKAIGKAISKTLDTAVDISSDVNSAKAKMKMIDGVDNPELKMQVASMIWDK